MGQAPSTNLTPGTVMSSEILLNSIKNKINYTKYFALQTRILTYIRA